MRVDHRAAARANMRARTAESGDAKRLTLTPEEKQARIKLQERLAFVRSGCLTCSRHCWQEGDGSTIGCAVLKNAAENQMPLAAEERKTAEACPLPALYTEVFAGKRVTLTRLDVLRLVPFHVTPEALAAAAAEAGEAASPAPEAPEADGVLEAPSAEAS